MDRLTAIKIKYEDGTYSDEIPIYVTAENVEYNDEYSLIETLGYIDVKKDGTIQEQINKITSISVRIPTLENRIANIQGGTPTVVDSISDMINTDQIYILSIDSKWYYYDLTSSAWTAGGVYGGVPTDTTLTESGMAADAKVAGDELSNLKSAINNSVFDEIICYGNSNDFAKIAINAGGKEVSSDISITSKKYFNAKIYGIVYLSIPNNYVMRIRAWDKYNTYLGILTDERIFSKSGTPTKDKYFDFTKFPDLFIRISLLKEVDETFVNITIDEASNIKLVYKKSRFPFKAEVTNSNVKFIHSTTPVIYPYNENRGCVICEDIIGNVIIDPIGKKYATALYIGEQGNIIRTQNYSEWKTEKTVIRFDTKSTIQVIFANIDDTTPFDIDTFEGYVMIVPSNATNALAGKKISVIGDSISSFDGYISPDSTAYYPKSNVKVKEQMYWGILAKGFGASIEIIDAFAGSTVAEKWQDASVGVRRPFIDEARLSRLGNPDIIIVEGGTNDFGGNPLGEYPTNGDYSKTYEFRTAYAYLLDQLKQRYPMATIVCLSLMTMRNYNNSTFPEKQTQVTQAMATDTTPHYLYEFNETIEKLCMQYECKFCNITNLMNYYVTSSLGVHPLAETHSEIAQRIKDTLNNS